LEENDKRKKKNTDCALDFGQRVFFKSLVGHQHRQEKDSQEKIDDQSEASFQDKTISADNHQIRNCGDRDGDG
jgi:hypothetical protein